jgi:nitroreductase
MVHDLIKKNRSYRRYYRNMTMSEEQLKYFVELARLSASIANLQHFSLHGFSD